MELAQSVDRTFSLDEISSLSGVARRTIRYYIELDLLEGPIGETRAAHYTWLHLQRLLDIRRLSEQGVPLQRIRERLAHPDQPVPFVPSIEVRTHLQLAPGISLVVEPGVAQISPEQLRRLMRESLEALERVRGDAK